MTIQMDNWCDTCGEACHDHSTICSVCGTALGPAPAAVSSSSNSRDNNNNNITRLSTTTTAATNNALPDGFMDDLRGANRDLHEILGSLRGQVQDLNALTRRLVQQGQARGQGGGDGDGDGDGEWQNIPAEILNPTQSSSSRPTSKAVLAKIPRVVLDEKSTLFRHATLEVPSSSDNDDDTNGKKPSSSSSFKFSCVMGEFGSMEGERQIHGSPLVVCSPLTGKGGELTSTTKQLISHLSSDQSTTTSIESSLFFGGQSNPPVPDENKVVAYMQRGDGVTFVEKAMLAQRAGAAAVIIGNNTSSPWPYVMKDSKNEAVKLGLKIPVAMIKEEDSKQLLKLYKQYHQPKHMITTTTTNQNQQDNGQDTCYMSCNLRIEKSQSKDCVVCCEKLSVGDTIMQLPGCGHVFHSDCALAWLVSHNTCPYCRRELPTDDVEYERERRRQQRTHAGSSINDDPSVPNETAEAFYG